MKWTSVVSLLVTIAACSYSAGTLEEDQFQTVNIAEFSSRVYGTELLLLENSYRDEKSYRFEDFFWTGSGDGASENEEDYLWGTDNPATIYQTKTVVSTIYKETTTSASNFSTTETTTKCSINCEVTTPPAGEITPTPTLTPDEVTTEDEDYLDADREFWLLTVLKSAGKDPSMDIDLKNSLSSSLATLYKTAFQRHQEQHLGIMTKRYKRSENPAGDPLKIQKPVKVYIHNLEKLRGNHEDNEIQVLYHVAIAGKPVSAITASEDMTLVSDDEVRTELGYPFLIKAEPYLKAAHTQGLARADNTWIFIGVAIVASLLFLLMVAFLTLGLSKRKRKLQSNVGDENRRQIFERGVDNGAFVPDAKKTGESPTYINFRNRPSNETVRSGISTAHRPRAQSSISTTSSSSASLDISPLMRLKKKQQTPPKKPQRPKAAKTAPLSVKRIAPEFFDSDSSNSSKIDSPDTIFAGNLDPGVMSPKSYLSMPSVKSFPRGTMPEPLNKVLEPVSVLHLDMPDDDYQESRAGIMRAALARHASVGAVADPGVIGPIVWNMHCQRLQHGVSVDEGIDDLKVASNVSRMRKRFHDLLDDTFSLFGGSRRDSPIDDQARPTPIEVKSHSAINTRPNDDEAPQPAIRTRPKTTDPRRILKSPGAEGPKGAWSSSAPSPLIRPLSAGPTLNPKINVDLVLAEGKFKPNDPAVPLIAAIKNEISKCSLPGSTADLNQ